MHGDCKPRPRPAALIPVQLLVSCLRRCAHARVAVRFSYVYAAYSTASLSCEQYYSPPAGTMPCASRKAERCGPCASSHPAVPLDQAATEQCLGVPALRNWQHLILLHCKIGIWFRHWAGAWAGAKWVRPAAGCAAARGYTLYPGTYEREPHLDK
eukprot:COSAG02_NODE_1935_length_10317_cov_33.489430_3_plen_155_part_00